MDGEKKIFDRKFFEGFPAWEMALLGRKMESILLLAALWAIYKQVHVADATWKLEQQKKGN